MDFYALAWLSGFAFVGCCLLIVACSIDRLAAAIREQHQDW